MWSFFYFDDKNISVVLDKEWRMKKTFKAGIDCSFRTYSRPQRTKKIHARFSVFLLLGAFEGRLIIGRKLTARFNSELPGSRRSLCLSHLFQCQPVNLDFKLCEEDAKFSFEVRNKCPLTQGQEAFCVIADICNIFSFFHWDPIKFLMVSQWKQSIEIGRLNTYVLEQLKLCFF